MIVPSTAPRTLGVRRTVTRNFGIPLSAEEIAAVTQKGVLSVTLVPVTGTGKPTEVLRYGRVYLAPR